jgi:hypothetical protein
MPRKAHFFVSGVSLENVDDFIIYRSSAYKD